MPAGAKTRFSMYARKGSPLAPSMTAEIRFQP